MLPDPAGSLPAWLVAGILTGVAAVLVVAGIFVAGDRLFPSRPTPSGRGDGADRRRAEIRTYLAAIDERYTEDATVGGETVAFYLPEREVAITFDPQAYFRIGETGADAVLCEYEMPAAGLGRRLPFEVPAVEAGGEATDAVAAAFSRLGVSPDADADSVEAAYRRRVKEVHPDHGGDAASFRRLREAYATAREHADGGDRRREA